MEATQDRINGLIEQMKERAAEHGLSVRCPECNAGVGKWCMGTERLAGPTDSHPSHQARLVLAGR